MIDREVLRRIVGARYRHRHEGFGFRLRFNDIGHPNLLIATAADAFARTTSFFDGFVDRPIRPVEIFVRSRYHRVDEPRAACLGPTTDRIARVYLNLYNRERLPLDSAYFWDTVRAMLVHEFGHVFLDEFLERRPLPLWMEEGTARYVERRAARRNAIGRGQTGAAGADVGPGPAARYEVGHRIVGELVGRFGLVAWLETLAEVAAYLGRKRRRARRALAGAGDDRSRLEVGLAQSSDIGRRVDRILSQRFGLDRAALSGRLGARAPAERVAEWTADPFDRLLVGRLDAGPFGRAAVAVALLDRPAHQEAPVATAVARRQRPIERLVARARREGRPVDEDTLLALRIASGRRLHTPLPGPLRRDLLAARGGPRPRIPAERLALLVGPGDRSACLATLGGRTVFVGPAGRDRTRRLAARADVEVVRHELARAVLERLVPGELVAATIGRLVSR